MTGETAAMTRIINHRPSAIMLGKTHGKDDKNIVLIPGGNNVPANLWKTEQDNRSVKMWLAEGILEVGPEEDLAKPEGPEPPKTLSEYSEPKALLMIETETSKDVLERWSKKEKREEVKTAIRGRIQLINSARE